jgi:hypothetical protein
MPKEDWRSAVRYVLAHAQPGNHVAFHPPYVRTAFDYYALPHDRWSWTPPVSYPLPDGELIRLDPGASNGQFAVWLISGKERYVPIASLEPRWLQPHPRGSFCPAKELMFEQIRLIQLLPCRRAR